MKTLEQFSSFTHALEGHELAQVAGGDYSYTIRNYYGTITYTHIDAPGGRSIEMSEGVDSSGHKVLFSWDD